MTRTCHLCSQPVRTTNATLCRYHYHKAYDKTHRIPSSDRNCDHALLCDQPACFQPYYARGRCLAHRIRAENRASI